MGTVSPTLSGWFNQRRSQVKKADYVERHALSGGLGRALADGWAAFDDSRLTDADRLASQADQIAKTELHEFVVRRFKTLVETLRTWIERNGVLSLERSEDVLETIGELYTDEENQIRERFNRQMPSRETYLKAMGKGIVEIYAVHSSAAPRILFADYVLQGTIDAHEHAFDDAKFWASAAAQTLDSGDEHIAVETLRGFVQRKRDLIAAEREFNALNSVDAIDQLTEKRANSSRITRKPSRWPRPPAA